MNPTLERLLQHPHIWQGRRGALKKNYTSLSTGFKQLDSLLPNKGWPVGELTEIITPQKGIGELRLVIPCLAQLSQYGERIAWVAPPHLPYPLALSRMGLDLTRLLLIQPDNKNDTYWALEQIMRSGVCKAVLAWTETLHSRLMRRLQLAAEAGQSLTLLFSTQYAHHSPAGLRLALQANCQRLQVSILKCRGAWTTGSVCLPV